MERVEKLVTKMQKKNALLNEGGDGDAADEADDALADADEDGGRKEPLHSKPCSPSRGYLVADRWTRSCGCSGGSEGS